MDLAFAFASTRGNNSLMMSAAMALPWRFDTNAFRVFFVRNFAVIWLIVISLPCVDLDAGWGLLSSQFVFACAIISPLRACLWLTILLASACSQRFFWRDRFALSLNFDVTSFQNEEAAFLARNRPRWGHFGHFFIVCLANGLIWPYIVRSLYGSF